MSNIYTEFRQIDVYKCCWFELNYKIKQNLKIERKQNHKFQYI